MFLDDIQTYFYFITCHDSYTCEITRSNFWKPTIEDDFISIPKKDNNFLGRQKFSITQFSLLRFLRIRNIVKSSLYIKQWTIHSIINEYVDQINERMMNIFPGET